MNKVLLSGVALILLLSGAWLAWSQKDAGVTQSDSRQAEADRPLTVAVSFYPLEYAVTRIADGVATVINIGAGRDPHDFRPSTQNLLTLQRADLVVLQGAGFEPWAEEVAHQLQADAIPVLFATDAVALLESSEHHHDEEHSEESINEDEHSEATEEHSEDEHDHEHGSEDPHTWLDPVLFSATVVEITELLSTLDPQNASLYEQNAALLLTELETLDDQYTHRLQNCTYTEAIITHDSFGYLADRYNLEFHPIAGLSTQDTPSATLLADLRAEATEGMGAILLEENAVQEYGDTLARETGLLAVAINPISYIIPEEDDYLTLMRENLNALSTAFDCNE